MDVTIPSESSDRRILGTAEEFDALWEQSKHRAESRPGPCLEELKLHSSRLRRMARLHSLEASTAGSPKSARYSLPRSSRKAG